MKISFNNEVNQYQDAEFILRPFIKRKCVRSLIKLKDDENKLQDEMIAIGVEAVILGSERIEDRTRILEIYDELPTEDAIAIAQAVSEKMGAKIDPKVSVT